MSGVGWNRPATIVGADSAGLNARRAQADYSVDDWNREYDTGVYREKWDLDRPGADLVALAAAFGLRSGVALDLGCGAGTDAIYLASRGLAVVGIDISRAALAIAGRRGRDASLPIRVTFCEASIFALPVESASVDFANDRGCLHSLRLDDWDRYADELARVMRPGALAAIRGCRDTAQPNFTALSEDRVFARFGDSRFVIRAVEPLRLCTARGHMPGTFMLLERRAA